MDNLGFIPDSLYVSLFYFAATGKWPNLRNPVGYNEKLQWLKLHGDYSQYTDYVDKLKAREIVKRQLGDGYSFELLGQWRSFDEIDFDKLPNEFVLKCNHDSGSTKLIYNKAELTQEKIAELKEFYDGRMKHDAFVAGREPSCKGIDRWIMAEEMMKNETGDAGGISDYKFFCFDGVPKLLLYITGRQTEKHEDYFDMDYNWLPEIRNGSTPSKMPPAKPACFEEMKQMAAKLAKGMKHVRMDFYEINGKPYFGEYTFFSGGGFELFYPKEWEKKLGDWIDIKNA